MDYLEAASLLEDDFGWIICMADKEETGKIQVVTNDGVERDVTEEELVKEATSLIDKEKRISAYQRENPRIALKKESGKAKVKRDLTEAWYFIVFVLAISGVLFWAEVILWKIAN